LVLFLEGNESNFGLFGEILFVILNVGVQFLVDTLDLQLIIIHFSLTTLSQKPHDFALTLVDDADICNLSFKLSPEYVFKSQPIR